MKKTSKKIEKQQERERKRQRKASEQQERQRKKAMTAKERREERDALRQEEKQRKAQEAAQRIQSARESDGNLFNHISQVTHGSLQRVFSNLRFSLGLRISVNYARLLLSMYFRNWLVFFLLFVIWQGPMLLRDASHTARYLQTPGAVEDTLDMLWQNPVYDAHFADPQEVARQDADLPDWLLDLRDLVSPIEGVRAEEGKILLVTRHAIEREGRAQVLYLSRNIVPELKLFLTLMGVLLIFDLLRSMWFLIEGVRINRKVLRPIAEITQHAAMLSENDLSLRLNIAGTKNELKDLAVVINEMLDRIETAYNGQKQFVSDASHELRTPIAVIQGYAGLLKRWGMDKPEVRDESIAAILAETENMKNLVEKLLFLARHDKHTLQLKMEHFDIRQLMEEVIRETEMITSGHVVETGKLATGIVYGDRAAIKQAIRIFIDNAVKYTPAGGTIRISCLHENGSVAIAIGDSGIGMTKKELQHIFERFYRADEARTSQTSGHGLGLSIAKIIVLSHGGKIHVRSQKNVGSTFAMVLPI